MPIDCHVPIAVRMVGEPTPAQLEQLGRALARTVAARVAQAERVLAERHHFGTGTPPPVRERYEPARDAANDRATRVPSYDDGGRPVTVPVHPPGPVRADAGLRFEDRLLLEASVFLRIGPRELARLRRVVDWYADTVNYRAFTEALRRDGLESFFLALRPRSAWDTRPSPSAGLSADTIRMIYGPVPEDPDHWTSLTFEERRAPIEVGDRTHLTVRDRTEVIDGVGDQGSRRVVVQDRSWEMTPDALRAFLVSMAGGQLTAFEEKLVANWNTLRPVPQFDGPRIVGYYLVSGGSGMREHRVHDPDGNVAAYWTSEAALVNEGLGPIEYVLLGRAALQIGSLALRAGARLVVSGMSSAYARNTLLALRLATRRLGRPLGATMEGTEIGLGVPGIGAGRPVPALVSRETAAIDPVPPRGTPSGTVGRVTPSAPVRGGASGAGEATPGVVRRGGTAPAATPRAATATGAPRAAAPRAATRGATGAQAARATARVVAVTTVDGSGVRRVTGGPGAVAPGFRGREEAARVVTSRGTSTEAQVMGERGMHVEDTPNRTDARRRPAATPTPTSASAASRSAAVPFADRVHVGDLENGLPTGTMGELTPADLNTGTSSAHDVNPVGQQPEGVARYGARKGHLLANVMGGSGRDLGNLAWMHVLVNNSSFKTAFENPVIRALRAGHNVRFGVRPKFRGREVAPYEVEVWATTSAGQVVVPVRNIRTPGLSDLSHNPAD
ncbi:DNA/RNA non-specific endonuclease [Streptomyces geranii]|uniref:DNA/RNA non-specific endonuclease n=1 Tax=Streptomyces geranii TaxID=2058923 RepID=UPI000D046192|nr:DNA/RNA non-specific endonuclease [Streptomyces geranii]